MLVETERWRERPGGLLPPISQLLILGYKRPLVPNTTIQSAVASIASQGVPELTSDIKHHGSVSTTYVLFCCLGSYSRVNKQYGVCTFLGRLCTGVWETSMQSSLVL